MSAMSCHFHGRGTTTPKTTKWGVVGGNMTMSCRKKNYMGVSKNRGTPKSSILIGCSIINHPFWDTPIFGNTHIGNTNDEEG